MGFPATVRVVLLLLIALFLPAMLRAEETVRIGVLAKRGPTHTLRRWQATADYLSREIPDARFTIVPLAFEKIDPSCSG